MDGFLNFLVNTLFSDTWETVAVALAILYLLLAIKQHISCWIAAFFSSLIYTFLYWDVGLFMFSLLNVFYVLMAIYGWCCWHGYFSNNDHLPVKRWTLVQHVGATAIILIATYLAGLFLKPYSEIPYIDAFTTFGAVVTTYMVSKKVLENWVYWLVINSFAIYLNIYKGFHQTAILYLIYHALSVIGFINWHKNYCEQTHVPSH